MISAAVKKDGGCSMLRRKEIIISLNFLGFNFMLLVLAQALIRFNSFCKIGNMRCSNLTHWLRLERKLQIQEIMERRTPRLISFVTIIDVTVYSIESFAEVHKAGPEIVTWVVQLT